jgi:hypothetical protein
MMMPLITSEQWDVLINKIYNIEFDWVGVDKIGQIAIFSSFNAAYIPEKVLLSFEKYLHLSSAVNNLLDITESIIVTKQIGNFNDWSAYSKKGLYAYDYQDSQRTIKLEQYDLISKPKESLNIQSLGKIDSFIDILPLFNVTFQSDISFHDMKNYKQLSL